MQSKFNVYCSEWVFGFGRFIAIITSKSDVNGKEMSAEVFVFAFDMAPQKIFSHRVMIYCEKPEVKGIIDLSFMEQMALQEARNLIYSHQYKKYMQTKDTRLMENTYKFVPADANLLITLKISGNYETELRFVMENTKSEELKKYISLILSFPRLEIKEYGEL